MAVVSVTHFSFSMWLVEIIAVTGSSGPVSPSVIVMYVCMATLVAGYNCFVGCQLKKKCPSSFGKLLEME